MDWPTDWGTMFLLFALYLVFAAVLTWYFSGTMLMFVVMMLGFSLAQYYFSDRLTLYSMGAKQVTADEYPELHGMVGRLSQQADLPTPTVAVVDSPMPNAFATGRSKNHAAVAVTTGLMHALTRDELEGVIAHELAHIKNRDMAIMTIASMLGTIAFIIVRWGWLFGGGRNRNQAPIYVAILVSLAPFFFPIVMELLGLLIGVIQAYVFAVLALVYIASAARAHREEEEKVEERMEERAQEAR